MINDKVTAPVAGTLSETSHPLVIVGLDAGHGGRNHGTSHGQLLEPELALVVTSLAAALLAWSDVVHPTLIRQEDLDLTPDERAGIAARAGCAAVVSVHFNYAPDPDRCGTELYHRRGDHAGRALGVEILSRLPGREWRAWIADVRVPGAVVITNAYPLPCALLEFGFLSSWADRDWLRRPETTDEMARAVAQGCVAWAQQTKEVS